MTTERLYLQSADEILTWLDGNPTEVNSIERRWIMERLASKLETIADKAADEDDAAYQTGYDTGYGFGYEEGVESMKEDLASEIEDLESRIEELEEEIRDLEDQASNAFAEGYQAAARDNDAIETLELS